MLTAQLLKVVWFETRVHHVVQVFSHISRLFLFQTGRHTEQFCRLNCCISGRLMLSIPGFIPPSRARLYRNASTHTSGCDGQDHKWRNRARLV